MKKWIFELEKDWIAYIFAFLGLVLIVFPGKVTAVAHYIIGVGLLIRALAGTAIVLSGATEKPSPGLLILHFALGAAIIYHREDSIQLMGFVWAIMALYEAGEEIDALVHAKKAPPLKVAVIVVSCALALILLFSPFHHFTFHVRVLGVEMLVTVFIRHTVNLRNKKALKEAARENAAPAKDPEQPAD